MKHAKKHKDKKSSKSSKKSKKSDRKKEKKHKTKDKKKRDKKLEKVLKSIKEVPISNDKKSTEIEPKNNDDEEFCGPSIDLMNQAKRPETKAEYDHRQSQIKRVVDPETGRIRLIKGDGEILEEIVTRDRHKQINQDATRGDGQTFQRNTVGAMRK